MQERLRQRRGSELQLPEPRLPHEPTTLGVFQAESDQTAAAAPLPYSSRLAGNVAPHARAWAFRARTDATGGP